MGICDYKRDTHKKISPKIQETELNQSKEICVGTKYISNKIINNIEKSICKITYKINDKPANGSGFFMNLFPNNDSFRYLITNHHVIPEDLKDKKIELEIHNKKNIELFLDTKNRTIHFFNDPSLDITVIQIKDEDSDIIENVNFLNYDKNYLDGYDQYRNADVFTEGYPFGDDIVNGVGKIIKINNWEFDHNIPTDPGSSGSPIILLSTSKIIGVHKRSDKNK